MKKEITGTSIEIKNGMFQWCKAVVGDYVDFLYDDIIGRIFIKEIIKDNEKNYFIITYNNKEKKISPSKLGQLQISDLLEKRTYDFKYNVGYKYSNKNGSYEIVDRYKDKCKKYKIKCLKCGYISTKLESDVNKKGCPVCTNQIVVVGINDMWTTAPWMAKLLLDHEDGYKYTYQSNIELKWKCPDCGNIIYKSPALVNRDKLHCNKCNRGTSYANRFIFNILTKLGINFKSEIKFDWSKGRTGKVYDFYLIDYDWIIEAHGLQHYEYTGFTISLEEQQKIDKYKKKLAIKNGITKYIVIDCRESKAEYIYNNLVKSELSNIMDFSDLNLKEIDTLSTKSIMFDIVELYKNNKSVDEIKDFYKLSNVAVYNYLHKAEEIGLIEYNYKRSNEERSKHGQSTFYQKHAKPFICIDNNIVFGTLALIENEDVIKLFGTKLLKSNMCEALNKNKPYKGFTFIYITKEEFNRYKEINPDKVFGEKFETI